MSKVEEGVCKHAYQRYVDISGWMYTKADQIFGRLNAIYSMRFLVIADRGVINY